MHPGVRGGDPAESLFPSKAAEYAMGSLRTRRAFQEVCSMRAEAVCALLRDRAGFAAMAVLSTALAGRLSVAAMSSMNVPALVTLAGHAWFVDVSGESAGAEESPRSLRRLEEGHNKCLTRKVIRIVPAGVYSSLAIAACKQSGATTAMSPGTWRIIERTVVPTPSQPSGVSLSQDWIFIWRLRLLYIHLLSLRLEARD
ncbi:hypothetical protein V502_01958 [Pseudogymnoascus sp. VKM F-4520 (FW-2644)]|nr:hypothetical protein V502_01958 [Pseudogymnoascus sp. VKM F-4520 (FW-2644)]